MNKKNIHSQDVKSKKQILLVSPDDVATMLGVSVRTVKRRSQDGRLPPLFRIGGVLRMRYNDLLKFIENLSHQLRGLTL